MYQFLEFELMLGIGIASGNLEEAIGKGIRL